MRLALIAAVIAFAAGFLVQGWRMDAQIAEIEAANSKAQAEAAAQAALDTARMQKDKDNALRQATIKAAQNALAANSARTELDRLRKQQDASATAMSDATCTSVREHAAALNTVFGECVATLEGLARKADGHALDQRTLSDSFPRSKP
jgi:hypothetical protein